MSDQEPPAFTVVDRRQATSDESHPNDIPPAGTTETERPSAETEEMLPDPMMLVSFGAMQMDTRSLAKALLAIFDGHAWRGMGLVSDPRTGQSDKDLNAAQLAIDCVQFLLGKVENDLSESERRDAQRRLNDLRMNYVAKLREP